MMQMEEISRRSRQFSDDKISNESLTVHSVGFLKPKDTNIDQSLLMNSQINSLQSSQSNIQFPQMNQFSQIPQFNSVSNDLQTNQLERVITNQQNQTSQTQTQALTTTTQNQSQPPKEMQQKQKSNLKVFRSTFVPLWSVPPKVLVVEDDDVCQAAASKFLQVFFLFFFLLFFFFLN